MTMSVRGRTQKAMWDSIFFVRCPEQAAVHRDRKWIHGSQGLVGKGVTVNDNKFLLRAINTLIKKLRQ